MSHLVHHSSFTASSFTATGRRRGAKLSAEPTCHVHPLPCWLSPFHPVLAPVTGTARVCRAAASSCTGPAALRGRKMRTLLCGPQTNHGPCVWTTSQRARRRCPWWRGGHIGQGHRGELCAPPTCSLTTGVGGLLPSSE